MYTSTFVQATIFGLIIDLIIIELVTSFLAKTSSTKILSFIFAFAKSIKLPPNHLYLLCLFEDGQERKERLARLEIEEQKKKDKKKVTPKEVAKPVKGKGKAKGGNVNVSNPSRKGSIAGTMEFNPTGTLNDSQMGMLDDGGWDENGANAFTGGSKS